MRRLRWLHVQCAAYLLAAKATLAMRTLKALDWRRRGLATDFARAEPLARTLRNVANRSPIQIKCLDRSLALMWLLRAHGLTAAMRIGVERPGAAGGKAEASSLELEGHAWVEHDGKVLADDEAGNFIPFDAPVLVSE